MSASDFLIGYALGAGTVVAVITLGVLAIAHHAREVDTFFNKILDPVPSNVRILHDELTS